jgi:hypothetical protein
VRRYAGDDVRQVIVVSEPVAGEPRSRRRRRRAAAGPPAAAAPVTRVTVIFASPLEDPPGWLRTAREDEGAAALARLVGLYRVAAADPLLADPDPARALVVRVGYGRGEVVAEGSWEAARELGEPSSGLRLRRGPDLRPHERLAALLSARDAALACEELCLRARADLDHGREREAAIQLEAALLTALAELQGWRGVAGVPRRVTELEGYRKDVSAAALAAREGRLEAAHVETVSAALARLEAALRARAAGT